MTMAKSARAKGLYTYPRKIGRQLGIWYYGGIPGSNTALYPTHGSGVLGKRIISESGDLSPIGEWSAVAPWVLSVELKHQKRWTWKGFMANPSTSILADYWRQCFYDAIEQNTYHLAKFPLLIFTKNYEGEDYAMFSWNLISKECRDNLCKNEVMKVYMNSETFLEKYTDSFRKIPLLLQISTVGILSLTKFLHCVSAETLRKRFRKE